MLLVMWVVAPVGYGRGDPVVVDRVAPASLPTGTAQPIQQWSVEV
jgi:hypothetical protein